ncbi:MAG TPA: hypothetical protein VH062_09335 [Polyangiaceae bacterium]|jgi:hypothetical protein|nr:hypothetical protein [Polyangiaceae bacterium]
MIEIVPISLVCILGFALATVISKQFEKDLERLIFASFFAHIFSAFGQVWLMRYFYGSGDILGYTAMGEALSAALRVDFYEFFPEVLKMLVHLPAVVPVEIPGQGTSTASMGALACLVTFFTGGSAYTLCCVVAIGGFLGQVAIFRAFRNAFPREYHVRLAVCATLIPSAVFWSSGFLKEAVAMFGFGYVVYGIGELVRKPGLVPVLIIAGATPFIGLIKPYILVGCLAGGAAWIFFRSSDRGNRITGGQVVVALFVAALGSAAIQRLFPSYSLEGLGQQAAYYQEIGQLSEGGSNYQIADLGEKSLGGTLIYAPVALFTSLFRPILVEVRSPQVFINSLETTAVLVLIFRAIWRRGVGGTWAMIKQMPMLAFCLAFVLVFGTGVGFTTTNLGTLSRYRMPLVPFLWSLALVLGAEFEKKEATERSAVPPFANLTS